MMTKNEILEILAMPEEAYWMEIAPKAATMYREQGVPTE